MELNLLLSQTLSESEKVPTKMVQEWEKKEYKIKIAKTKMIQVENNLSYECGPEMAQNLTGNLSNKVDGTGTSDYKENYSSNYDLDQVLGQKVTANLKDLTIKSTTNLRQTVSNILISITKICCKSSSFGRIDIQNSVDDQFLTANTMWADHDSNLMKDFNRV